MVGTETSLFATGVYGVVKVAGCAAFLVFVADSLGRRRSLLWTSAAQGLVMFIIGIYGRVEPPVADAPVTAFGYVAITCIYLWAAYVFSFSFSYYSSPSPARVRVERKNQTMTDNDLQFLPVRLGSRLLDSHLRDSNGPSPCPQRRHRCRHPVALQLCRRSK